VSWVIAFFFASVPVVCLFVISGAMVYLTAPALPAARSLPRGLSLVVLAGGITFGAIRIRAMIAAIRRAEAKYQLVVSRASEAIVIDEGATLEANFRTCQMLGCAAESASKDLASRPGCRSCRLLEPHRAALFGGAEEICELNIADRNGRTLVVELSACRLGDGRAMAVLRDITARRQAEAELHALLGEKELLLREIHHRVKNNLQIIASLLSLQADTLADPASRRGFEVAQERVNSIALAHQTLYGSRDVARVELQSYLTSITGYLACCYEAPQRNIAIITQSEVEFLDLDRAIPCGLIVTELVSNALKHAFPDTRGGTVMVEVVSRSDGRVQLSVRDTGRGLPPHFRTAPRESLGLQLVDALTRQLHGQLHTCGEQGTCFELIFDAAAERARARLPEAA